MTVAEKIRHFRISKNLTQEFIANELNISQSTYSSLENGTTKLAVDKAEKLSEIYDIDPCIFFSQNAHINSGQGSLSNSGTITFETVNEKSILDTISERLTLISKTHDDINHKLESLENLCYRIENNYIRNYHLNKPNMAGNIVLETLIENYKVTNQEVALKSGLGIETIENLLSGHERMTIVYAKALGDYFEVQAELFFKENIQTIHINSAHGAISSSGFIKAESNSYLGYVNKQDEKLISRLENENEALKAKIAKLEEEVAKK